MKKIFGVILSFIILPLTVSAQTTEAFAFKSPEVKALNVHNSMGAVTIATSLTDKAAVTIVKNRWGDRCSLKVNLEDGTLNVISDDQSWILDTECQADFIISVAPKTKTLLRVGVGNVDITGLNGELDMKIGSGSAKISGEFKDLQALTGQGEIKFTGSALKGNFRTGRGDVAIDFSEKPKDDSFLFVHLGRGDVEINLPEQTEVFSTMMTGNGSVRNEFDQLKSSHKLKIQAHANWGDIKILSK